jgi:hypothetical protein
MNLSFEPRERLHQFVVFSATLIIYAATMPQTITLEDAGLFQMVCHLGGISHPPGYPLFTNLCQGFVSLPFFTGGVIAGNFLSALFASLACAVFFSCCISITRDTLLSYVAAFSLGLSATFWSQAIIIEVYSFTVLLFVLVWRLLLAFVGSGNARYLYLAIFVYALSLTNHWPLMILSTPALLATVYPRQELVFSYIKSPGFWGLSFVLIAIGLSPYITLLLHKDNPIALYGDINSVEALFKYVARSAYSDHHEIADGYDRLQYMLWLLVESGTQMGLLGVPLMLLGLVVSFRFLSLSISLSLLAMYLGSTFLLNLLLNFSYEFFWQAIFKPYLVISCLALAFWFAIGVRYVVDRMGKINLGSKRVVQLSVATLVILSVFAANLLENNRRDVKWVELYGILTLQSLPENSVLFVRGDVETGVFGFLQLVMGVRPDIEIINWNNLVFSNRLESSFAIEAVKNEAREEFIAKNRKPVFASSAPLAPVEHLGAYDRYTPGELRSAGRNPKMDAFVDYLLDLYLADLITDPHEIYTAYYLLVGFTQQYVGMAFIHQDLTDEELQRLNRLQSTFPGKLMTLETLLRLSEGELGKEVLMEMAKSAEEQIPYFVPKKSLAVLYEYSGRSLEMEPADINTAILYYEKSIETYPTAKNTSICPLTKLYLREGDSKKLESLRLRFPDAECD